MVNSKFFEGPESDVPPPWTDIPLSDVPISFFKPRKERFSRWWFVVPFVLLTVIFSVVIVVIELHPHQTTPVAPNTIYLTSTETISLAQTTITLLPSSGPNQLPTLSTFIVSTKTTKTSVVTVPASASLGSLIIPFLPGTAFATHVSALPSAKPSLQVYKSTTTHFVTVAPHTAATTLPEFS
jgi:hypothetical protein